ncbi:MAG: thymidylate synthase [Pontimonas sp.]
MKFTAIVARDSDDGVSKEGKLPWINPSSVATFRDLVRDGDLVPEPRDQREARDVFVVATKTTVRKYRPECLVICTIDGRYGCDETIDDDDLGLKKHYSLWGTRRSPGCTWRVYTSSPDAHVPRSVHAWHWESAYLDLVRDVLETGAVRDDRTGTGTKSVFGRHLDIDLAHGFPLLTTKKTFWKGITKEILWFLQGRTDAKELSREGVRIWDGNTSASFLRDRGLDYQEGDAGPVYGFQWRHWGAEYRGCDTEYRDEGSDQLKALVRGLRTDPFSRRHVVSAWNVADLDRMALPPCHVLFQCYVTHDHRIDLHLYQRSVDVGLGLPFNIASYALLVHLLSSLTGYAPGRLVMSLGDVHIYSDHVEQMERQRTRVPKAPPRLLVRPNRYSWLHEFRETDISLEDYHAHPAVPMRMAV